MKTTANRQQKLGTCQSRQCAYCGKDMTQGHSAGGFERLIGWAREAGVKLAIPDGRYLNPTCAAKVQRLISECHPKDSI